MHLGSGAITPECAAITWGAAVGGLALCGRAAYQTGISREKLLLAAALGCFTFAAQAVNVPLAPGFSGHLVGGALLAWLLGPGLGAAAMALVLLLQALLLGDGGVISLGANILNMALVPAAIVALARQSAQFQESRATATLVGGLSVVLAAAMIVGETALFRPADDLAGWSNFAARMLAAHLWIGLFEAAGTMAALSLADAFGRRFAMRLAVLAIASAVIFAAALVPMSSSLPDGYEAAAQSSGLAWLIK